jgi:hypothetical protein
MCSKKGGGCRITSCFHSVDHRKEKILLSTDLLLQESSIEPKKNSEELWKIKSPSISRERLMKSKTALLIAKK